MSFLPAAVVTAADQISAMIEVPDYVIFDSSAAVYSFAKPALDGFESLLVASSPNTVTYLRTLAKESYFPTKLALPLLDPVHAIFCIVFYFVALFALYAIGKLLGKGKYRHFGLIHNAFLFGLSFYMWFGLIAAAIAGKYTVWNNPVKYENVNDWRMTKIIWIYYISKLPEFGDTFLMVLKHNYHQVSFLHLYHHSTVFVIWFVVCLVGPGGDSYWSAMLNSGIHVIMYGYYFGTMLFEKGMIRRFLDSIKFMITKGQMTQFMLNVCQTIYLLLIVEKCLYPTFMVKLLFWYMLSLLILFGNFLIKGTRKQKSASSTGKATVNSKMADKITAAKTDANNRRTASATRAVKKP